MSIYSIVTEKDLINLRKLAEQQKNQRALKIKNKILKQTHDVKLAESLSPITEKLDEVYKSTQGYLSPITKKMDTINESTKQLGEIVKESNSEKIKQIVATPSILSQDTFKSLTKTPNSLKFDQDKEVFLSFLGTPKKSLGGDKLQVFDNIYEFNTEIHKALSRSSYTGKSMKNEKDQRTLYIFLVDVGYTGVSDEKTNQKKFFTRLFKQFGNFKKEESDNLQGEGVKIIIPSNVVDIYTRLEILLGLKLSGHTDTLTEATNLGDELYKRGAIQNKQQYRNALNKFITN